jgi:hypothetical protein
MKRVLTIFLAFLVAIFAATMIVKSNQKYESDAGDVINNLTPETLVSRCGQPAADFSKAETRRMYYPMTKDGSMGLIFSFSRLPGRNWTYSSFYLGAHKNKTLAEIDTKEGANSWAIIELPCLNSKI